MTFAFVDSAPEIWDDPEYWAACVASRDEEYEQDDIREGSDAEDPGDDAGIARENPYALIERSAHAARVARADSARLIGLFHETLVQAERDPDPWVGPDPTLDPLWTDPRGWSITVVRARRRHMAVRAAAADIAVRVQLTDSQVRARAHHAAFLQTRCPKTWAAALRGDVSEQNVVIAADVASSLPERAAEQWAALDDALCEPAASLVPKKFRQYARAVRERIHPESLSERHARASEQRYVAISPDDDGMAVFEAYVAADKAHAIDAMVDDEARHLRGLEGETRTLAQIRADVFTDVMLTSSESDAGRAMTDAGEAAADAPENRPTATDLSRLRATVRITIPALTLLGHGDEPATLDGYGPIPLDTAKELAAGAKHWIRVLTDPVTSTIIDVDRRMYTVPAAMKRMLHIMHPTCVFPGCSRPSSGCDSDHRRQWQSGGTTSLENLAPISTPHHAVKDETLWGLVREPKTGRMRWISPSGYEVGSDPPF